MLIDLIVDGLFLCMNLAGLILAAGESKRLGEPKQLVRYKGKALINTAIDLLSNLGLSPVTVVLGAHFETIKSEIRDLSVTVVENKNWKAGMGSSLSIGIEEANRMTNIDGALVMLCDQPKLTSKHLQEMLSLKNGQSIIASEYNNLKGVPAIFPRRYFRDLMNLSSDIGARKLIAQYSGVLSVPCVDCGFDVDTPDDLRQLKLD